MQGVTTQLNQSYSEDRTSDLIGQAQDISNTIGILRQQLSLQQESAAAQHDQTEAFHNTIKIVNELRDKIADFDDFFRPVRNYLYWEPHCYDIPSCSALRSVFDAIDGID
jgi:RND superfamily putative drug exporter